jgi:hypothetical protein
MRKYGGALVTHSSPGVGATAGFVIGSLGNIAGLGCMPIPSIAPTLI